MTNVNGDRASLTLEEKREQEWLDNIKSIYRGLIDEFGEAYCLEQIEVAKQRVMTGMQARDWNGGAGALEATALAAQSMEKAGKTSALDPSTMFVLLAGIDITVPGYFSDAADSCDPPLHN